MAEGTVIEAVKYFEACLRKGGVNISKIVLFGSRVKGYATKESDIDMAVVSKDFEGKDIFVRARLTKEAEILTVKKFMIPLDIITMTPEEFESEASLIAEYARDGEIVYAQ